MPAPCIATQLDSSINGGCSSQLAGFESTAVLIPASLINRATLAYDSGTFIVNTLALTSGAGVEVTVTGDMPYSETVINGTQGAFVQLFESVFAFPILENSPAAAKQVAQLGVGEYVAVLKAKGYDPAKKNKYMIIGLNRGLRFRTANFSAASQDEFGWRIELAEADGITPVHFFWAAGGEGASDTWFSSLA